MAIKIYEQFAPFANPADGDYPYGSIKNDSIPGAEDGTPLDAVWANDMAGFTDALLSEAGIVPSGAADTAVVSQRLDALKTVVRQDITNPDKGAAMVARGVVAVDSIADLLTLLEGQRKESLRYLVKGYHAGSDVGGGEFYFDSARTGENDGGVVFNGFVRHIDRFVTPEFFGAVGDGLVDDFDSLVMALNYGLGVVGDLTYRFEGTLELIDVSLEGSGTLIPSSDASTIIASNSFSSGITIAPVNMAEAGAVITLSEGSELRGVSVLCPDFQHSTRLSGNGSAHGIVVSGGGSSVLDCRVEGVMGDGIYIDGIVNSEVFIKGNLVRRCHTGIHPYANTNNYINIHGNTVEDISSIGILCDIDRSLLRVTKNYIKGTGWSHGMYLRILDSTVSNNSVRSTASNGIKIRDSKNSHIVNNSVEDSQVVSESIGGAIVLQMNDLGSYGVVFSGNMVERSGIDGTSFLVAYPTEAPCENLIVESNTFHERVRVQAGDGLVVSDNTILGIISVGGGGNAPQIQEGAVIKNNVINGMVLLNRAREVKIHNNIINSISTPTDGVARDCSLKGNILEAQVVPLETRWFKRITENEIHYSGSEPLLREANNEQDNSDRKVLGNVFKLGSSALISSGSARFSGNRVSIISNTVESSAVPAIRIVGGVDNAVLGNHVTGGGTISSGSGVGNSGNWPEG